MQGLYSFSISTAENFSSTRTPRSHCGHSLALPSKCLLTEMNNQKWAQRPQFFISTYAKSLWTVSHLFLAERRRPVWEFPGSPVGKTVLSLLWALFDPCSGNYIKKKRERERKKTRRFPVKTHWIQWNRINHSANTSYTPAEKLFGIKTPR